MGYFDEEEQNHNNQMNEPAHGPKNDHTDEYRSADSAYHADSQADRQEQPVEQVVDDHADSYNGSYRSEADYRTDSTYHNGYSGRYDSRTGQEQTDSSAGNGQQNYHYSWNTQQPPIYKEEKKHHGKTILKAIGGIVAVAFTISVISLAAYGGITMMQNLKNNGQSPQVTDQQPSEAPSMTITGIDNYDAVNNPEVREGEPLTTVQIVKKVSPSVVGVVSTVTSQMGMMGKSSGSGIIMTEDGYIITNEHVIDGASEIKVVFSDSSEENAVVIGSDSKSDLAVLKINRTGLTAAEFGDSDQLEVGENVVAIGNPLGLELFGTAVSGIVSAVNREVTIEDRVMNLLQTTAPVNEGNSGGPLANQYGQIIGITSAKISATGVEGISFAIPIDSAKDIVDSLIQNGYVKDRPLIGISGTDIDEMTATYYDLPQGVLVRSVSADGGAAAAGIQVGDVITMADGEQIIDMSGLNAAKDKHKAGETMQLRIVRSGKAFNVDVLLSEDKPTSNG